MTAYYAPTETEEAEVVAAFNAAVRGHAGRTFKVGRIAAVDWSTLAARDEYSNARAIIPLWSGSRGKVAYLEALLINCCRRELPGLCLNQQEGGGPQSGESDHVLYVVFW